MKERTVRIAAFDAGKIASRSRLEAPRVLQPGVDDLPLVPAPGLKIQERGSRVLQLHEKF
jgi:hypothetical protein